MNKIKIRLLQRDDQPNDLLNLFKQLTKNEVKIDIDKWLAEKNIFCYLGMDGDKCIAFASLSLKLVPTKGYVGVVEDVVVDENYRQQGVGTRMMKTLIKKAQTLNLKMIELTSNPSRIGARRLYEKLGFKLRDTGVFRMILNE